MRLLDVFVFGLLAVAHTEEIDSGLLQVDFNAKLVQFPEFAHTDITSVTAFVASDCKTKPNTATRAPILALHHAVLCVCLSTSCESSQDFIQMGTITPVGALSVAAYEPLNPFVNEPVTINVTGSNLAEEDRVFLAHNCSEPEPVVMDGDCAGGAYSDDLMLPSLEECDSNANASLSVLSQGTDGTSTLRTFQAVPQVHGALKVCYCSSRQGLDCSKPHHFKPAGEVRIFEAIVHDYPSPLSEIVCKNVNGTVGRSVSCTLTIRNANGTAGKGRAVDYHVDVPAHIGTNVSPLRTHDFFASFEFSFDAVASKEDQAQTEEEGTEEEGGASALFPAEGDRVVGATQWGLRPLFGNVTVRVRNGTEDDDMVDVAGSPIQLITYPLVPPYVYYMLEITKLRGNKDNMPVQLSEVAFYDVNGSIIKGITAFNPTSLKPINQWDSEGPNKVLDGQTWSKWLQFDFNKVALIVLEMPSERAPLSVTGIQLTTANDFPERDPMEWRVLGSNDAVWWDLLQDHLNGSYGGLALTRFSASPILPLSPLARGTTRSVFKPINATNVEEIELKLLGGLPGDQVVLVPIAEDQASASGDLSHGHHIVSTASDDLPAKHWFGLSRGILCGGEDAAAGNGGGRCHGDSDPSDVGAGQLAPCPCCLVASNLTNASLDGQPTTTGPAPIAAVTLQGQTGGAVARFPALGRTGVFAVCYVTNHTANRRVPRFSNSTFSGPSLCHGRRLRSSAGTDLVVTRKGKEWIDIKIL